MWGNKRAYIACIWLLSAGVMLYVAMSITAADLRISRDSYFREYRLADVFADVRAAGASAVPRLKRLPGVADAAVRRVEDCRVILPDSDKIVTLRIISADPAKPGGINGAYLSGDFRTDADLFVAQSFLDAHGLAPGGWLDIAIGGKQARFNIAGTASTPEYAYAIPSPSDFMPDPGKFNIAFAAEKTLNAYLGAANTYNSVGVELAGGVRFEDAEASLRDELGKYGLKALYKRDDQPSTLYINMEIDSVSAMASVLPLAFCGMAVIILYLMLKRVVEQDRTQIGTLKAFGFSGAQIAGHYMIYGVATGCAGSLLGVGAGFAISNVMSEMMRMFFNIPAVSTAVDMIRILLAGMLIGLASGALGAFMGASRVLRMLPAVAMKPEAPRVTKRDPLRYIPGLKYLLTSMGSMAVRNIARAKFRSFFIVMSVCFSFGILAFIGSFPTIIDSMMLAQFTKSEVYDLKISFRSPGNAKAAVDSVRRYGGVREAEALLELPARLSKNGRAKGVTLTGIPSGSALYRIYDEKTRQTHPPPAGGLLLAESLAESLGASVGDKLAVSSPYLPEDVSLRVTGLVTKAMGGAFIERGALADAFRMQGLSTSVVIRADDVGFIKSALKEGKNIAAITDAEDAAAGLEIYTSMINSMLVTYFCFGVGVALAIIYNTSTISFSERRREFSTLRVLGMTVSEIASIQSFEYWTLTAFGIALGIPYTSVIMQSLNDMIKLETFALPSYVEPQAYLVGFAGVISAVFLSNRVSRRKIGRLNMVEPLKEME